MNDNLITSDITQEWKPIPVEDILVPDRQRKVNEEHVKAVKESFESLGNRLQLQPIIVTGEMTLVDGAHRLEAAKRSGWDMISAVVMTGLSEDDRALLEAEANVVRKELDPVELARTWREILEPRYRKAGRARQAESGRENLSSAGYAPSYTKVVELGGMQNTEPVQSLKQLVKVHTGLSLDTINKVSEIEAVAANEAAPDELRNAAVNGLARIRKTNNVDGTYKQILKIADEIKQEQLPPEEVRNTFLSDQLDSALTQITMLAERLARPETRDDYVEAGKIGPVQLDNLESIRHSLLSATASIVIVHATAMEIPVSRLMQQSVDLLSEHPVIRGERA